MTIRSRSSRRRLVRLSRVAGLSSSSRSWRRISSIRATVSSICRIMACTRRVRRLNSSISVSIFRRRRMNRLRASCRAFGRRSPVHQHVEVLLVLLDQVGERLQVVRHPGDDLLLGEPLGQRDLDRAVEGQRAAVDLHQRADRRPHRHRAADDRAAEALPRRPRSSWPARSPPTAPAAESAAIWLRYMRIGSLLNLVKSPAAAGDRPGCSVLRPSPTARRSPLRRPSARAAS